MASYMSGAALNIAANAVTAGDIDVRIHSGAPGDAGTQNRIGTHQVRVPAAGWSDAAGGIASNNVDVEFNVLSNTVATTVAAYSLWQGATFLGWADLVVPVTVQATERFTLAATTVAVEFERP